MVCLGLCCYWASKVRRKRPSSTSVSITNSLLVRFCIRVLCSCIAPKGIWVSMSMRLLFTVHVPFGNDFCNGESTVKVNLDYAKNSKRFNAWVTN